MEALKNLFESYSGRAAKDCVELTSSGSNRRYFRLTGGNLSIVGVIGTNKAENYAFVSISRHFIEKGIRVPRVLAVSEDRALLRHQGCQVRGVWAGCHHWAAPVFRKISATQTYLLANILHFAR